MFNKDAPGDEACLMFSKGDFLALFHIKMHNFPKNECLNKNFSTKCNYVHIFPEIKCFVWDAATMEEFVISCDRTMMPVEKTYL